MKSSFFVNQSYAPKEMGAAKRMGPTIKNHRTLVRNLSASANMWTRQMYVVSDVRNCVVWGGRFRTLEKILADMRLTDAYIWGLGFLFLVKILDKSRKSFGAKGCCELSLGSTFNGGYCVMTGSEPGVHTSCYCILDEETFCMKQFISSTRVNRDNMDESANNDNNRFVPLESAHELNLRLTPSDPTEAAGPECSRRVGCSGSRI